MAINIQNIVAALEAKVAAATSTTETQELIVIIKSIKAAGQQTVVTYATVAGLPTASAENAGNLAFVADVGKIYYSNATAWTEVGSGSDSTPVGGDAVFDSALIGDVSIVGNEISAVDGYGASQELVISSDLSVVLSSGGVEEFIISPGMYNNISILSGLNRELYVGVGGYYGNYPVTAALLEKVNVGDSMTISNMYGNFILTIASVQLLDQGGLQTYRFTWNGPTFGFGSDPVGTILFTVGSIVEATPLSVTATGVNVDGAFTVNGQPVGGSSFDQDLNTTNDVSFQTITTDALVADSALIGDVTIVGNTISGTGPYGAGEQVVVDSDLLVTGDLIISNQIGTPTNTSSPVKYVQVSVQEPKTIINEFTLNSSMWTSISGYGSGMNYVQITTESYYGNYPETTAKLQNIKAGDIMFVSTQYGAFQFQISTIQPSSGGFYISWLGNNGMMQVDNNSQITFTGTIITSEKKDYFLPLYQ